jgi:hypothetical protein
MPVDPFHHRCRCVYCLYSEAWHRGERDLPEPTALQVLDCRHLARLGHANHLSDETAAWWARFEPHYMPWLRGACERGECEEPEMARFGAYILIDTGERRVDPDTHRERPGCSLDDLHGHELFESYGHGGLMSYQDARWVVWGTVSFARYLGEVGELPRDQSENLDRELETWAPRIVAYFEEGGPWYRRDGTPLARS